MKQLVSRWVTRYLNTGVTPDNAPDVNRQIQVANLFSFIGYSITFALAIAALARANLLLSVSLFLASGLFFCSHLVLRFDSINNRHRISAFVVLSSLIALMLYLVWSGGNQGTGPLWIYIVPPVAFFFGGLRKGVLTLTIFVIAVVALLFFPDPQLLQANYSVEFKTRLLYSFLTVTALFGFYEFSRQQSYHEVKNLSKQFERQARQDPLTQLPNRRGMMEKLHYEQARSQRNLQDMSLMMVDVDHFKAINDKYGHDGGDVVLIELARLFTHLLRKQDIVARWGGEEFLFLLPETRIHEAHILAEKIRHRVEQHTFEYKNKRIHLCISIGISQVDFDQCIDHSINQADHFLYQAKANGRNRTMPPVNTLGG